MVFALRRRSISRAGSRQPLERVAAFLISISRNNEYEGRDPHVIPESLTSGFVAGLLGMDLPVLEDFLFVLERHSFLARSPSAGLKLTDLIGLQRLADASGSACGVH